MKCQYVLLKEIAKWLKLWEKVAQFWEDLMLLGTKILHTIAFKIGAIGKLLETLTKFFI